MTPQKRKIPIWMLFILGLLSFAILPVFAQTCPVIVERALSSIGDNCGGISRNSACYGYSRVNATFATEVEEGFFSAVGDTSALNTINTLTTQPFNPTNQEWGVALLSLQANIPDTLPGQAVTFILMGDAEIENAVTSDKLAEVGESITLNTAAQTSLRSAPLDRSNVITTIPADSELQIDAVNPDSTWVRVVYEDRTGWILASALSDTTGLDTLTVLDGSKFTPMQAFYLRTGIGEAGCEDAPDTMLVQGPKQFTVDINVNGAEVRIGSTVALRTINGGDTLELIVIDGEATLYPDTDNELEVKAGYETLICLDEPEDLGVDGEANDRLVGKDCRWRTPQLYDNWESLGGVEGLPEDILTYEVEIPEPPVVVNPSCVLNPDWLGRYTVQIGDTLGRIAPRYNLTAQQLGIGNCIADLNIIRVGQELRVPGQQPAPPEVIVTSAPPPPDVVSVSISDATITVEGTPLIINPRQVAAGSATLTVSLSKAHDQTITMNYATQDDLAVAGEDYVPVSGSLTFAPGVTTQNITVTAVEDDIDERPETFKVVLSNIVNAVGNKTVGVVTINDDDARVIIYQNCPFPNTIEGATADITLYLSATSGKNISADFTTSDGDATAGADYVGKSGTVTIPAGNSSVVLTFETLTDPVFEATPEVFNVTFSNPRNATFDDGQSTIGCGIWIEEPPIP